MKKSKIQIDKNVYIAKISSPFFLLNKRLHFYFELIANLFAQFSTFINV